MRKCFAFLAVVFLAGSASSALAKEGFNYLTDAPLPGEAIDDRPAQLQGITAQRGGPCTTDYGYVDGDGFAVIGGLWTFDNGGSDPFEGWETTDVTQQNRPWFRHITDDIWTNGDGGGTTNNEVDAPILSGVGSAWVGAFENEADDLCWESGLGHGNSWCQRLLGPVLDHDGDATITISFEYFNDTEADFDYSYAIMQTLPSGTESEIVRFTDQIGLAPDHPDNPPVGATFNFGFNNFQGDNQFRLIFQMTADGGWSDEDGQYETDYGPFAADDVVLGNTGSTGDVTETYDFESDLNGWTPEACTGFGSFEGIADVSTYTIEDPCVCELDGNVLEHHDDNFEHPYGQRIASESPPVDVLNDPPICPGPGQLEIFADWSQYSVQPRANGVFYRPGWNYFPLICPATGETQWSGRVGQATWFSTGDDAVCFETRNIATDNGVPAEVEQIAFVYEIYASCDAFGIPPEECSQITNFTPLIDNIRIRFTRVPEAPPVGYDPGDRFTDGFSQSLLLDPNEPGNANTVINQNFGNNPPFVNGDTTYVSGAIPTGNNDQYDVRLWFRVARKGPGTNDAGYNAWRAKVQQSGGLDPWDGVTDIEAGEFATAKMDSFQIGANARPNRYHSYFIEGDARFSGDELTEVNEIIADGVLLPGTQIDYFVTSNFVNTDPGSPQFFLLPDTSGQFFTEFEILPGWRDDGGTLKYPCLLYVDASNAGVQFFVENALDVLGIEADRYDYLDQSSNWKTPMARGLTAEDNNGCSLFQLLGYRGLLVNTGSNSGGNIMWEQDYALFSDWLTTIACDANSQVQGLIMNGDGIANILTDKGPSLLNNDLDATLESEAYNGFGGSPDENYCVQLEVPTVGTPKYGTANSTNDYDYDAWGNWCPEQFSFNVMGTTGSGVGNRSYFNSLTFQETTYNQVANEVSSATDNYRSIIDAVSWHHMAERTLGVPNDEECSNDSATTTTAVFNEIQSALEWVFGVGTIPALCEDPCTGDITGVDGTEIGTNVATTRLFQNSPNPFNPYTTLRFSLAQSGPAELAIFDVNGRKVRTLVEGVLDAGSHEVVWDGTDDAGRELSSGVYWSQFNALGVEANKKMVFLNN